MFVTLFLLNVPQVLGRSIKDKHLIVHECYISEETRLNNVSEGNKRFIDLPEKLSIYMIHGLVSGKIGRRAATGAACGISCAERTASGEEGSVGENVVHSQTLKFCGTTLRFRSFKSWLRPASSDLTSLLLAASDAKANVNQIIINLFPASLADSLLASCFASF